MYALVIAALLALLFHAQTFGVDDNLIVPQQRSRERALRRHRSSLSRHQCPQGCFCIADVVDAELLIVSCRWMTIESGAFRESFPWNVTKSLAIHCSGGNGTASDSVTFPSFEDFEQLRELQIFGCKTRRLEENAFRGILKLRTLHLSQLGPKLELDQRVFVGMESLEKLSVTESDIERLPTDVLCPLKFLQILNVSSNKFSSARLGMEAEQCVLDHLIILDLSANSIAHLSSRDLRSFPSIRQLSLSSNEMRRVDLDAFKPTALLQHLDLDHNHLRELVPLPDNLLHLNLAANRFPLIPASVANLVALVSLNISRNSIDSSSPFSLITNSLDTLDLSGNQLSKVPVHLIRDSIDTLALLNLADNQIEQLEASQLENFTHLHELDLSHNRIKSLSYGIFNGLQELHTLRLSHNLIYHVDVEVFSDLNLKLQRLSMAHNLLSEFPMAIGRLSRIRSMDFSNNQISKAYKFVLNKMTHLTRLDLSNNSLASVESYVFSDSAHLTELVLRDNKIEAIDSDAFEKCPRLKSLNLNGNRLRSFNGALTGIKTLRLLDMGGNAFEQLDWSQLPVDVQELNAENNRIVSITNGEIWNTQKLNLRRNQIHSLSSSQLPNSLEELDVSQNLLQHLSNDTFARKTQLKSLNLRGNKLRTVPDGLFGQSQTISSVFPAQIWLSGNPLECDCEMGWITNATDASSAVVLADLDEAKCLLPLTKELRSLKHTNSEDFLCRYEQTCEPGCICCQYGSCDCKSKCPQGCECFNDNSLKANIVKCEKTVDSFAVRELPMHASHIFLSGLNLNVLKSHDFIGRNRLVQLHINFANLMTIQPLAFNTLPRLRVLDLSNNKLNKINGDEAFKTQRVQRLNLRHNDLEHIDVRLAELFPALEELIVDNNSFENLPKYLETGAAEEKLKSIALGGNPFRCDCTRRERSHTKTWFQSHSKRVVDEGKVSCVENVTRAFLLNDTTVLSTFLPNLGEDIFTISMAEFIQQENRSICVMKKEGIFGGSSVQNRVLIIILVVFVLLVIAGVLYLLVAAVINRGKSSSTKNRYKKTTSLNFSASDNPGCSPPPEPLIKYDIFISYSSSDEETARQLCSRLEEDDFQICRLNHSGRRYNAGIHSISDELNEQLRASQSLIILLTKNFVENEWDTVQIKTAHRLFARMKNKKLIAIISEEIRPNELDGELGQILRKNTCIPKNHHLFWNLLYSALPRRESPVCSETSQIYSDMYGTIVPSDLV